MPDPETDVATFLAAAGALAGVTLVRPPATPTAGQAPLYQGGMRPANVTPARAVYVQGYGGEPKSPFYGDTSNDNPASVQVLVASEQGDYAGGRALARAISAVLQRAALSGYTTVLVQQAEPNPLGQDAQGRHLFSVNIKARWVG